MNEQELKEFNKMKRDLKELQDILFGLRNDVRFVANVRKAVVDKEHAANKPTIVGSNGKRYNIQTV